MKSIFYFLLILIVFVGCNTSEKALKNTQPTANLAEQDTVRISNGDLEYDIIIIEPGFNFWLASRAKPEGYYSQTYMEGRNYQYVVEYNSRVLQPHKYNPSLYEMQINYDPGVDYGYEVNYKLYNYFIYFQLTHNQKLAGYIPRI